LVTCACFENRGLQHAVQVSRYAVLLFILAFQLPVAANSIACPLIPRQIVPVPWFVVSIFFCLGT